MITLCTSRLYGHNENMLVERNFVGRGMRSAEYAC